MSLKLGDRIRSLRNINNLTQGQLIEGIASITYLSKVENNQTVPTENFIYKIAERLNVRPDTLLNPNPDQFTKTLENIYECFWRTDFLTNEDLALLQLQANEVQVNRTFIMIFTTLIRYYVIHSNLKEAKRLFEQSSRLIKAKDSTIENRFYFHYYLVCGKLLIDLHILPQANIYLLKSEQYTDGGNNQDCAKLYFSLSLVNQKLNEDKMICLYYSEKALNFQKEIGNQNRIAMVLFVRSIQFHLNHQPADAIRCFQQAKDCQWDEDNINLRAVFESMIGCVYQAAYDFDQAIKFLLKSIESYEKSSFKEKAIQAHKRLIEIYIEKKEWLRADRHLYLAQRIADDYKDMFYDVELDILQANIYKHQAQDSQYEKVMKKLIERCEEQHYYYHLKNLAAEFGHYFYQKQSYRKSAHYYNQSYTAVERQNQGIGFY